jgi:23S rRNA (adenine2503-C2)-methyltransferase
VEDSQENVVSGPISVESPAPGAAPTGVGCWPARGVDPSGVHLLELMPEELLAYCKSVGIRADISECRRILAHVISLGKPDLNGMLRPVSTKLVRELSAHVHVPRLELVERFVDPGDNSVRYLFRHADGALAEAVLIPLHKEGRFSVCLSSQVGCAMRCAFCATGRLGLKRNLAAWEIVAAFLQVRADCPGRITGAVFMGQGEPFHNYDAVIRAAQVLSHPCGGRISGPAITISTVGLLPRIRQYTAEKHNFRLIVSVTSSIPERREQLVPVASKWSLEDLFEALREHQRSSGGRQTVAYVMLGGVNTGKDEAEALQRLVGDMPFRLNLIDVNDARPDGWKRAEEGEWRQFMDHLQILKSPLVRRYSVGQDQRSACGMLAASWTSPEDAPPAAP